MARYSIKLTIQANRIPDPPPAPAMDRGKDPIVMLSETMRDMTAPLKVPGFAFGVLRESGLTLNKEAEITAESFQELAGILGRFDTLTDEIECANPAKSNRW